MKSVDKLIYEEFDRMFEEEFKGYEMIDVPHPSGSVEAEIYLKGWHAAYERYRKLFEKLKAGR